VSHKRGAGPELSNVWRPDRDRWVPGAASPLHDLTLISLSAPPVARYPPGWKSTEKTGSFSCQMICSVLARITPEPAQFLIQRSGEEGQQVEGPHWPRLNHRSCNAVAVAARHPRPPACRHAACASRRALAARGPARRAGPLLPASSLFAESMLDLQLLRTCTDTTAPAAVPVLHEKEAPGQDGGHGHGHRGPVQRGAHGSIRG
jgi:hypothetical protein